MLVGSAVLCPARAVLRRQERTAGSVMGSGLRAYALGNLVWSIRYARAAAPLAG